MTFSHLVAMLIAVSFLTSCYLPISGKVIDADTQQPIEGAVVLVEWNEQHGFGLTYHTVYKTAETETNKEGKFSLPGAYSLFVDQPYLVIYKSGYVAWRNDDIFPDYEKRSNGDRWRHNSVYKLEKFKDEYSLFKHSMFMDTGIMDMNFYRIPKFANATRNESIKASSEGKNPKKAPVKFDFNGRILDAATGEPIEGTIVLALYDISPYSDPSVVLEGVSNRDGVIKITGEYPWPYRLPQILIYKKGYLPDSSRYGDLSYFKWKNGYIFKLYKCNECEKNIPPYGNYSDLNDWANAAAKAGRPLLMDTIRQDIK